MKTLKIFICVLILPLMMGCGSVNASDQHNDMEMLHANNDVIVNESNEEVVLKGVNLGGWLLQEYWMCPVKGNPDIEKWTHTETLQVLQNRFGYEIASFLLSRYEDNWITEYDIKTMSEMGMNAIRVPFGYWNFMKDANGTWINDNTDKNPGFKRLDWVIETASKYDVYVILDMHGCPGGQTTDHVCGCARKQELFGNENYQRVMEELWITIANRYKNNPTVAAYDIMNEGQDGDYTVENDPRNLIYDRMYKAIRKVDSKHIIMMEGIWSINKLPKPQEMGWENVVYQTHPYGESNPVGYCESLKTYAKENKVPVYVGEFSDMNMLQACKNAGISCTSWTYKGTSYASGTWFIYYKYCEPVDVYNDSIFNILKKWEKF